MKEPNLTTGELGTERILLADSWRGIWGPHHVVCHTMTSPASVRGYYGMMPGWAGLSDAVRDAAKRIRWYGPDGETYWDDWRIVCDNVQYLDVRGKLWFLQESDGDIWLVPENEPEDVAESFE